MGYAKFGNRPGYPGKRKGSGMMEYDLHTAMVNEPAYRAEKLLQENALLRRENGILRDNAMAQGILDDIGAAGKGRAVQIRMLTRVIANQRAELRRLSAQHPEVTP